MMLFCYSFCFVLFCSNAELTLRLKIRRATFLAWSLLDEAIVAHRPQLLDAIGKDLNMFMYY